MTDTYSIALYQLTHPSIDAVTKKQAQDFLWAELVALTATVAALTAENERLRSALANLLDLAPPPIAGRNDYASARTAACAALPSSRETTDG